MEWRGKPMVLLESWLSVCQQQIEPTSVGNTWNKCLVLYQNTVLVNMFIIVMLPCHKSLWYSAQPNVLCCLNLRTPSYSCHKCWQWRSHCSTLPFNMLDLETDSEVSPSGQYPSVLDGIRTFSNQWGAPILATTINLNATNLIAFKFETRLVPFLINGPGWEIPHH